MQSRSHLNEYQLMKTSWKENDFERNLLSTGPVFIAQPFKWIQGLKKKRRIKLVIVVIHCGSYHFHQAGEMNEPFNKGGSSLPLDVVDIRLWCLTGKFHRAKQSVGLTGCWICDLILGTVKDVWDGEMKGFGSTRKMQKKANRQT